MTGAATSLSSPTRGASLSWLRGPTISTACVATSSTAWTPATSRRSEPSGNVSTAPTATEVAGGPAVRLYRAEWPTNCERVGMALAHKGIEAQSILIEYSNRGPVEAISGQGLVPVIEDAGAVIHDSVAIMRHLDRRTPERPLFPAEPVARARVDLFVEWFE